MPGASEDSVDHVLGSVLPWRSAQQTRCGRAVGDVAAVITLDQLEARINRYGRGATTLTVCATCCTSAHAATRWEVNPIGVVAQEAVRCGFSGVIDSRSKPEARRFAAELYAIAALIRAHRDEFEDYISALARTTNIAAARHRHE